MTTGVTHHNREEREAQDPLVSVIIPVFNAEKYLQKTLESALEQTYSHLEILLVDDGSEDESPLIAEAMANRHPSKIKLLRHQGGGNRGVSESRNLALAHASGEYIAFLDADDLWYPSKLERQVSFMQEHSEVGLSFTKARIFREELDNFFLPGVAVLGHEAPADRKQTLLEVIAIRLNYIFSTVIVRTDLLRNVGGFVMGLPFQTEDRIMVAMISAEHRISLLPDVLGEYRAHDGNYTARVLREKTEYAIHFDMQVRIMEWTLKRGRRDLAVSLAVLLLPGSMVRFLATLRPGTLGVFLRDFGCLLRRMPHWPLLVISHHIARARDRLSGEKKAGDPGSGMNT